MIRRYCDRCNEEITDRNKIEDLGRVKTFVQSVDKTKRLSVEIITSKNGTYNEGDFCKYCVIDAVNALDDRTVEEEAKP